MIGFVESNHVLIGRAQERHFAMGRILNGSVQMSAGLNAGDDFLVHILHRKGQPRRVGRRQVSLVGRDGLQIQNDAASRIGSNSIIIIMRSSSILGIRASPSKIVVVVVAHGGRGGQFGPLVRHPQQAQAHGVVVKVDRRREALRSTDH